VGQWVLGLRRNRLAQSHHSQAVELKHLSQLQDAFLGTMSYELRIPLSNMQMAIQMLTLTLQRSNTADMVEAGSTQAKLLQYLDVLQRECDRETKLIQDLLDLQQVDADRLSLVMSAIDLEEWLPYSLKGFVNRAKDNGLELDWMIPAGLPSLMSDQITLSRIMTELVGNALRFTPAGGAIRVELMVRSAGALGSGAVGSGAVGSADQLVIAVMNCGVEIPIVDQAKVFDKFYRVPSLDVRRSGGIGLGLPLAQQLARQLGGDIQLESAAGRTCFSLMLPL
jgi:signal transduction histidine kinase